MKCPLVVAACIAAGKDPPDELEKCLEKDCPWWDGECPMVKIKRELGVIRRLLEAQEKPH